MRTLAGQIDHYHIESEETIEHDVDVVYIDVYFLLFL